MWAEVKREGEVLVVGSSPDRGQAGAVVTPCSNLVDFALLFSILENSFFFFFWFFYGRRSGGSGNY